MSLFVRASMIRNMSEPAPPVLGPTSVLGWVYHARTPLLLFLSFFFFPFSFFGGGGGGIERDMPENLSPFCGISIMATSLYWPSMLVNIVS